MHLEPNARFAAFFLSRCRVTSDLPQEEELEPRVWESQQLGLEVADYWHKGLGTLMIDEMKRGGLAVYVTAPPELRDGENTAHEQRVNDILNALLLQGVPRIEQGFIVHGGNVNGEILIDFFSPIEHLYCTAGPARFVVGMAEIRRSLSLAQRLHDIQVFPRLEWRRLVRGLRTLLLANRQDEGGDRLHQFIRAVEAVIKPRVGSSRKDFAHRGQTLAGNNAETNEILLELYDLRSAVEHLNVPTNPHGGNEAERLTFLSRRTRQADALARHAFLSILESPELLDIFRTDEHIEAFWHAGDGARMRVWGNHLDIVAIQ